MKKLTKAWGILFTTGLLFIACDNLNNQKDSNVMTDPTNTTEPLASSTECSEDVSSDIILSDGNWTHKLVYTEKNMNLYLYSGTTSEISDKDKILDEIMTHENITSEKFTTEELEKIKTWIEIEFDNNRNRYEYALTVNTEEYNVIEIIYIIANDGKYDLDNKGMTYTDKMIVNDPLARKVIDAHFSSSEYDKFTWNGKTGIRTIKRDSGDNICYSLNERGLYNYFTDENGVCTLKTNSLKTKFYAEMDGAVFSFSKD
ncbi:MAG: hypothetical protein K6A43_05570 [Treponema sp.]|nr:hypothetical protein [Treponema sp.]